MSEIKRLTRNYEVSVWTLQDSFITVLGSSNARYRDRIQNPEMKLVNDGTQEFSFSIPMYLDDGVTRKINPIWNDIYNAPTIAGMRKIKVIFNKGTDVEAVFEFLITKVTKIHEEDRPYCDVSCEGLAFHELGKIGYKIEFSTDVLTEENTKWYNSRPAYEWGEGKAYATKQKWQEAEDAWAAREPNPTIDYWLHEVMKLEKRPASGLINAQQWYYKIDMDWSEYANLADIPRDNDKIYDEQFVTAWTTELLPKDSDSVCAYKEKTRIMDEKESNIYNLTQKLAETFEVFCRYEYEYDDNYHIKSRTIVFYNKAIKDKEKKISFTYPYSSKKISREDDCTDIVTKMYVTAVDDQSTDSGLVTIISSSANKMMEDYIMNFDYLYEIKTITDEQYAEISKFEKAVRAINEARIPLENQLLVYQDRLPKVKASLTISKNAAETDEEMMNNSDNLAKALDKSDKVNDGYITVTGANAKLVQLIEESKDYYYFKAPEKGIDIKSIRIYKKQLQSTHNKWVSGTSYSVGAEVYITENNVKNIYTCSVANSDSTFTKSHWTFKEKYIGFGDLYPDDGLNIGIPEKDEMNDFVRMTKIPKYYFANEKQLCYITFRYSPKLYYEKIKHVWELRLTEDTANIEKYTQEVNDIEKKIKELQYGVYDETNPEILLQKGIKQLNDDKENLIREFEQTMGPALREGYWTPDNYDTRTGEKYVDYFNLDFNGGSQPLTVFGSTEYASFVWDTEPFEDEQLGYYEVGLNKVKNYYPCILLNNDQVKFIQENSDKYVGVLYFDYTLTQTQPIAGQEGQQEVDIREARLMDSLVIGSSAQLIFVNYNNAIQPALILTGTTDFSNDAMDYLKKQNNKDGKTQIGYISAEWVDEGTQSARIVTSIHPSDNGLPVSAAQWIDLSTVPIVYPRIKITSLALKNNTTDLTLNYNYQALKDYEDYYILQRVDELENETYQSCYYISFKPEVFLKANEGVSDFDGTKKTFGIRYCISNASTAIYLDSIEVLKENSKPKVTYTLDPNILDINFTYTAYNALNVIAFINDYELQFEGAQGYISTLNLNLDYPDEDTLEIKNYKNKFEDLFSTIVAQTQAMEKNESIINAMSKVVSVDGSIAAPALEGALRKVDLNYQFNQGKLTISEANGIWGTSDDGVVAYRGGGIFTATKKDENGNWIWNTGIVPQGINANAITAGQLDTSKIKVYSGDKVRFQLNSDGLFAYKALFSDYEILGNNQEYMTKVNEQDEDVDYAQYAVMNEDGLFLCAKKNALIVNETGDDYIKVGYTKEIGGGYTPISEFPNILNRVEISWDGLILRNWKNKKVFFADANTGDLTIEGTIKATGLYIEQNNTMQQVLFSVDPTSHNIKLSSTNFDNGGIKSSIVEIVPNGITIKSGGTLNLSGASVTLSANQIQGMPNMNNYYAKQVGVVDINQYGVDITGGRVNIDASGGSSYVHISTSQIDIKSGKITINNLPIWERNDIMYDSNPPTSGYPTDRAWLWAQPWGYNSLNYSLGSNNTLVSDGRVLNSSNNMKFTLSMTFYLYGGINTEVNNISVTCSVSGGISLSKTHTGVNFPAGSGNGVTGTVTVTSEWQFTNQPTQNLCNTSVLYYSFSGTSSYPMGLSTASLSATSADPNGAWSECKIYYFPAGTHP